MYAVSVERTKTGYDIKFIELVSWVSKDERKSQ